MAWPKTITIGSMKVEVDSWEEIREAIAVFGSDQVTASAGSPEKRNPPPKENNLSPTDSTLLRQFVEAGRRGVLTATVAEALGAQGKAIRPALDVWSRSIGLVTSDNVSAFENYKRWDGRAYRMTGHYLLVAQKMLGN